MTLYSAVIICHIIVIMEIYSSSLKRQSKEKTQYPEIIKEEIISNGGRFIIYNETKKTFDLVTDEHIHAIALGHY